MLAAVLLCALPLVAKSKQTVKLFNQSVIGGATLKAGEYEVDVAGNDVVFFKGKKEVARAPFHPQAVDRKFSRNSLVYEGENVTEIRLEGSNQKLVLEGGSATANRD
jgi:hypothetical protein